MGQSTAARSVRLGFALSVLLRVYFVNLWYCQCSELPFTASRPALHGRAEAELRHLLAGPSDSVVLISHAHLEAPLICPPYVCAPADLHPRDKLPGIHTDSSLPAMANSILAKSNSTRKIQKRKTRGLRLEPAESTHVFQRAVQKVAFGCIACGVPCKSLASSCAFAQRTIVYLCYRSLVRAGLHSQQLKI